MSHTDDVSPWDLLPSSNPEKRTRHWWVLLTVLAVAALAATEITVQVRHFLYGSVPLAYMSPGFGTGGWGSTGSGSPWDTPVVSPDGRMLYVPSGTNSITPVATATRKAAPRIRISGPGTVARIAVTPDSRTLFAAMLVESSTAPGRPLANTVTSVSLRTGEPGIYVGFDTDPTALAITPDGRTLYVIIEGGMEGNDGQPAPSKVTAIDTATSRVRASLTWKAPPRYLTMAPNGKTLWVVSTTGEEETTADNTVTPVNVATGQPGPSLHTSGWLNHQDPPSAAAISPDSHTLYIAVRNGLETFRVSLPLMRSSSVTSTRRPQRSSPQVSTPESGRQQQTPATASPADCGGGTPCCCR